MVEQGYYRLKSINKEAAIGAIDRNMSLITEFLTPPADWAVKFKERALITPDTFDKSTSDTSETPKRKAMLMLKDLQRCIEVSETNAFSTLVHLIRQDQFGARLSQKLINSYKAHGGGSEIDDHLGLIELSEDRHLEIIDDSSLQSQSLPPGQSTPRKRHSTQQLLQFENDSQLVASNSLIHSISHTSSSRNSFLRPESYMSGLLLSNHLQPLLADYSLSSQTSSGDDSSTEAGHCTSQAPVDSKGFVHWAWTRLPIYFSYLICVLDRWKMSGPVKCLLLLVAFYGIAGALVCILYLIMHKTETETGWFQLQFLAILLAGSILLFTLFGIGYKCFAFAKQCLSKKHCNLKTNWKGKSGVHITRQKHWGKLGQATVCLQSDGSTFSGFVVKLAEQNFILVTCLHCFQAQGSADSSEIQWKSICRRVKKCCYKFNYVDTKGNFSTELSGKELLWSKATDKKNLFAEPNKDLVAIRLDPEVLPLSAFNCAVDIKVMRAYIKSAKAASNPGYWVGCTATVVGHASGGPLCQSGGEILCVEGDCLSYKVRTERGYEGSPVVVTISKKDKARPVVVAVHLDRDVSTVPGCNKGRLLASFLEGIICLRTSVIKNIQ